MSATMAKKKQPADASPPGRPGRSIQLYVPPELAEALDAYVEGTRPKTTKTAVIVMLLEDFLRQQGKLPPAAD